MLMSIRMKFQLIDLRLQENIVCSIYSYDPWANISDIDRNAYNPVSRIFRTDDNDGTIGYRGSLYTRYIQYNACSTSCVEIDRMHCMQYTPPQEARDQRSRINARDFYRPCIFCDSRIPAENRSFQRLVLF